MESISGFEAFGNIKTDNGYTSFFARKKGRSHSINGTLCQDYCLVKNIGTSIQVIAIADGHGGEAYVKSDIGSKIACELLYSFAYKHYTSWKSLSGDNDWVDYFTTSNFKSSFISTWKSDVLENYKDSEELDGESDVSIIKKYGTTLIFAILTEYKIVIGQLGDGAVLLFDNNNQFQLFKRHGAKMSSSTSSLVSSRAEYAFYTECYTRQSFPYILLSTDGIYDKLDTSDAFYIYGQYLVNQICTLGSINSPFHVNASIDVSEITKDDCTIVLIDNSNIESQYYRFDNNTFSFDNIQFYRRVVGTDIFTAEYENQKVFLHIIEDTSNECIEDLSTVNIVKPVVKIRDGRKTLYVFPYKEGEHSVKELIEMGEHLEKKYDFNNTEDEFEENCVREVPYSNTFWMIIYEQLCQLRTMLIESGISLRPCAFESAFPSDDGGICFYSDAFEKKSVNNIDLFPLKQMKAYFSILGKIKCGKTELPLFRCYSQGQNINMLHFNRTQNSLGRVIYNKQKDIYGLWNISGHTWTVVEEKTQSIPHNGVLRLNRNHSFFVPCNNLDDLINNAEVREGYVKYELIIYSR